MRGSPVSGLSVLNLTGWRPFGQQSAGARLGQSFQVDRSGFVSRLGVYLRSVGAPTDSLLAVIESDYGGLPAYTPPAQPLFADSFTGTNGTALESYNPRWQNPLNGSRGTIEIQNNQAQVRTADIGKICIATVETGSINQLVTATLVIPPLPGAYPNDWYFGVAGRVSSYQDYTYTRILYQDNSPEIELWDVVAGSGTIIVHNTLAAGTYTPGATHRLALWLNGTTASAYLDQADATAHADSTLHNGWISGTTSITTGTRAGLEQHSGVSTQAGIWDDFAVYSGAITNLSDAVQAGDVPARGRFVVFSFPQPIWLEAGTAYHWHLRRTGASSSSNYYAVGVDTTGGYSDGGLELYDSTLTNGGGAQLTAPYWFSLTGEDAIFWLFPEGR